MMAVIGIKFHEPMIRLTSKACLFQMSHLIPMATLLLADCE